MSLASFICLNVASASALSLLRSGCHFFASVLYAVFISSIDADSDIPSVL